MKFILQKRNQQMQTQAQSVQILNQQKIQKRLDRTIKNNKYKSKFYRFVLRNCKMQEIPLNACKILQQCPQLQSIKQLDISQMRLRSLINLPLFSCLLMIDLTMNYIRDDQVKYILKYTTLQIVYLTQNFIQKLESIQQLKQLPKIKEIDISQNPVEKPEIIAAIFNLIPQLKICNRHDRNGRDLQKDLFQSDSQSQESQSNSQQKSQEGQSQEQFVETQSNVYENSDVIYQDSFMEVETFDKKKNIKEQQIQQEPPRKYLGKKLNQMTNEQIKQAFQESKRRLRKLLEGMG